MTRYSAASRRASTKRTVQTPAIWRGIGCILLLIVPVMAWVLAVATIQVALRNGWPLPSQLLGYPELPEWLWDIPALWTPLGLLSRQPHLYMTIVLAVLYTIAISGLLSVVYSVVYRIVGPPRYGPLDLPQPQVKVGRYKR
jgi:hypothetical protein